MCARDTAKNSVSELLGLGWVPRAGFDFQQGARGGGSGGETLPIRIEWRGGGGSVAHGNSMWECAGVEEKEFFMKKRCVVDSLPPLPFGWGAVKKGGKGEKEACNTFGFRLYLYIFLTTMIVEQNQSLARFDDLRGFSFFLSAAKLQKRHQ